MQNGLYVNTGTEWRISTTVTDGPVLREVTAVDGLVYKLTEEDISKAPYIEVVFEPQHAETLTYYNQSPVDLSEITYSVNGVPQTLNGLNTNISSTGLGGGYITIQPPADSSPVMYGLNNNYITMSRVFCHIGERLNKWRIGQQIKFDLSSYAFFEISKHILSIDSGDIDGNYAFFDRSLGRFGKLMDYGIIGKPETYPYLQDKPGHVIPVYDLDLVGYIYKAGDLFFVLLDYRTGTLFTMGFVLPYADPASNIECEQQMFGLLKSFHTYVNNKAHVVAALPTKRVIFR